MARRPREAASEEEKASWMSTVDECCKEQREAKAGNHTVETHL